MAGDTYYEILGVSPTATQEQIKARYRDLIRRIHPDRDGPAALFRQVQEAYEVLSVPARRSAYDRASGSGPGPPRTPGTAAPPSASKARQERDVWGSIVAFASNRRPPEIVGAAGALLVVLGAVLAGVGTTLVVAGLVVLLVAGVAGLGERGARERAAYERLGMSAVDAMTSRQFEALLQHHFATKGFRVARIGGRGEFGVDLLVHDADGRMIVQARRWSRIVPHDVVEHAVAAKEQYGAARALLVTSSDLPRSAAVAANSSGVTVWNRAELAAELTVYRSGERRSVVQRFSSDLGAGLRVCLGFVAALAVLVTAMHSRTRRPVRAKRRHG